MQTITLTITNVDRLPDGGPISHTVTGQRFEIGRDSMRDWVLPDAQLYISGRHCEIAPERGSYVLNDVSRNGTFVNGAQQRVKSPYVLRNGDMLAIGHYVVLVKIAEAGAALPAAGDPWGADADDDIWGAGQAAPPPMDRRAFEPAAHRPGTPDFVESHLDMPVPAAGADRDLPPAVSAPARAEDVFGGFQQLGPAPDFLAEAPKPVSAGRAAPRDAGREDRLLAAFREGARLPPGSLANRDPVELFHELGTMMLAMSEQVAQLLRARASAKAMVKTSDRTMITAMDNNPLKFMPDPVEALQVMLTRERTGYLDGPRAFREAFDDLKQHEIATYAAMQKALSRLLDDLSPEAVQSKVAQSPFSNRKAKAWETFVARWEAKTESHANGMLDVFLGYFSEAYQQMSGKRR